MITLFMLCVHFFSGLAVPVSLEPVEPVRLGVGQFIHNTNIQPPSAHRPSFSDEHMALIESHSVFSTTDMDWISNEEKPWLLNDDEERDLAWNGYYFDKFAVFPDYELQLTVKAVMKGLKADVKEWAKFKNAQLTDPVYIALGKQTSNKQQQDEAYLSLFILEMGFEVMSDFASAAPNDVADGMARAQGKAVNITKGKTKKLICKAAKIAAKKWLNYGSNYILKRGIGSGSSKLLAKSFIMAGKVVGSAGVGIASFVGEFAGGQVAECMGFEDGRIKNSFSGVGAIGFGAVAGATVGGPVGAVAGAVVGGTTYALGAIIGGLFNMGWGPNDNWVYVQMDSNANDAGWKWSIGTYNGGDSWTAKSYWVEYPAAGKEFVMSAGQRQKEYFKVSVWYKHSSWYTWSNYHIERVYYRDHIFCSVINGQPRITFFGGEKNQANSGASYVSPNLPPFSNYNNERKSKRTIRWKKKLNCK